MGWYEAMKDVLGVVNRIKDAELQQKIAKVHLEGAKLAEDFAASQHENISLKEQLRQRSGMIFDGKVWWQVGADGKREGPICPTCYGEKGNPVRMVTEGDDHQCPVCKRWAKFRPTASYGEAPEQPGEDWMNKKF